MAIKGNRGRDNIHSFDVVSFIDQFIRAPHIGEVYNLGGGRENSVSILEAISLISAVSEKVMHCEYLPQNRKRRSHLLHFRSDEDKNALPKVAGYQGLKSDL